MLKTLTLWHPIFIWSSLNFVSFLTIIVLFFFLTVVQLPHYTPIPLLTPAPPSSSPPPAIDQGNWEQPCPPDFSAVLSHCPSPASWKPRHLVRIHPKTSSPPPHTHTHNPPPLHHLRASVLLGNNQTESQDIWAVEEQKDAEEEENAGEATEHTTERAIKVEQHKTKSSLVSRMPCCKAQHAVFYALYVVFVIDYSLNLW